MSRFVQRDAGVVKSVLKFVYGTSEKEYLRESPCFFS